MKFAVTGNRRFYHLHIAFWSGLEFILKILKITLLFIIVRVYFKRNFTMRKKFFELKWKAKMISFSILYYQEYLTVLVNYFSLSSLFLQGQQRKFTNYV